MSYIQKVQDDASRALQLVKHYRDIADRMEEKIELVRDFWRNEIKEGSKGTL